MSFCNATDTEPSYVTEVWIEQQVEASAEKHKRIGETRFLYEKAERFLNHPAKDDVLHTRAIEYLRKSAEAGYGDAALLLAQNYMGDSRETHIPAEPLHWYKVAAMAGNTIALQKLIIYYKEKPGVTVADLERSAHYTIQLLETIQNQKKTTAQRMRLQNWAGELRDTQNLIVRLNKLGGSWQEGAELAQKDHNKEFILAEELLADGQYEAGMQRMRSAAARGNEAARYNLAVRILNGPRSFDREIHAVTELQKLDRLGYLPASFRLGMLYQSNTGMVPKNLYLARELFKKSETDDLLREKAQRRLRQGFELIENLRIQPGSTALEQIEGWYKTKKGSSSASSDLRQQYRIYLHHFRDSNELKGAAKNGNDQAQYELAQILQSHDLGEAIQWLKRSAKQGNSFASYELAVRMVRGKKNPPETVSQLQHYARRAAEDGHVGAMVFLATNYRSGLGGFGQDSSLAKHYYQQALTAHGGEIVFVGEVAGKQITIERSHLERAIQDL